ncbi:histidine kinase [Myceligenerans pegani]|uniref:histidine kinase n=1 Tax=Myceligenerans pegani TaxID=2776917 RepID=A0ABR9MX49_9MICO|nr:histidine kinase [Myceligenerans sp. TRM 65318]MBE1875499.1 histidine kinase [Myceligenerans sp. TRM 65318]MBE3017770.1 histidine kinase [Myceligenerans sp. TRM 65318]
MVTSDADRRRARVRLTSALGDGPASGTGPGALAEPAAPRRSGRPGRSTGPAGAVEPGGAAKPGAGAAEPGEPGRSGSPAGSRPSRSRLRTALTEFARLHTRRTTGEWVADSLQVAVALLVWWFYGFVTVDTYPAVPDWYWPVDRLLGLVACLALWWARFRPVTVALVVLVPAASSMSAGFAALATVYRLGSHARPRVAAGTAVLYVAAGLPYHAIFPIPATSWAWWSTMMVLLYLVALSFGLLARSRRLALQRVRDDAARERELFRARILGARRDERERVAREMHDVLAHRVSLVSVHAGALEYRLDAAEAPAANAADAENTDLDTENEDTARTAGRVSPGGAAHQSPSGPARAAYPPRPAPPSSAEIREAVSVIRQNAHLAVEELRHVLDVLRADEPEDDAIDLDHPQPRLTDIARLVEEARGAGQRVTSRLDLGSGDLPGTLQRTAFRVVQEGLTNARKHAPRAHVHVEVVADDDGVRLAITNPLPIGVGPGEIPGAGAGLIGLDERVRLDGGTIEHGAHDGEFRLTARLGVRP